MQPGDPNQSYHNINININHDHAETRPQKRPRVDTIPNAREQGSDRPRFDFVLQSHDPVISPSNMESPSEGMSKKGNSGNTKKQPLSCAECRRLKLKVGWFLSRINSI